MSEEPYPSANRELDELQQAGDLLLLARDRQARPRVRVQAAETLLELGWTEQAGQAWLALARDEALHAWVREQAVAALGSLERIDDLLALVRDEQLEPQVRERAAVALGGLGQARQAVPVLQALANDEQLKPRVRVRAAEALGELGWIDQAVPALLALACDAGLEAWVRWRAAAVLSKQGRADVLRALRGDEPLDDSPF